MSSVRRQQSRLFQIREPAAPKLLSPKLLCIHGAMRMLSEDGWRDRRLPLETRWISSARLVSNDHTMPDAPGNRYTPVSYSSQVSVQLDFTARYAMHGCSSSADFVTLPWKDLHALLPLLLLVPHCAFHWLFLSSNCVWSEQSGRYGFNTRLIRSSRSAAKVFFMQLHYLNKPDLLAY